MKYLFTLILAARSITGLAGCSTLGVEKQENIAKMQSGMSEHKVLSLLGTPDSIISNRDQDRWIYEFKKSDKQGRNLYVDFRDGSLVKAGELSSRDLAASDENKVAGTCTRRAHREVLIESTCVK